MTDTPRSQIKVGGFANIMGGWLVAVETASLDDRGVLRCTGRVVSRPLCADNLKGENHPLMTWTAR